MVARHVQSSEFGCYAQTGEELAIMNIKRATILLSCFCLAIGWVPSFASTVPAEIKAREQWTEKQRIGDDIPLEAWRDPAVTPWAALLCLHGLSLHAKNYADFGTRLGHLGIPTYAIDIRGFGSWQNTGIGYDLDFESTFKDIENALEAIHKAHPGLPVILLGESMGGGLAIQAAGRYPALVDGLICSVPAEKHSGQKSNSLKVAVGLITGPSKELSIGPNIVNQATTNPEVAMTWESDPLARMNLSAKDMLRYEKLMRQNIADAERISKTPVLFLQGGSDRLIKPAGTLALFNRLKTNDKDMVMVGSAEHLIFEQGQFTDEVVDLVSDWIDKHVVTPQLSQTADDSIKIGRTVATQKDLDRSREAVAHFKIAEGYLMLNAKKEAGEHLLAASRIASGSALAARAHRLMLELPDSVIAPQTGATTAAKFKLVDLNSAKANDKPSILVFIAPWIESCKNVTSDVRTAVGANADKINLVVIDADDPKNNEILTEYGVKPLPTVLYLSGNNQVLLYSLGDPGVDATKMRVQQLLANEKAAQPSVAQEKEPAAIDNSLPR